MSFGDFVAGSIGKMYENQTYRQQRSERKMDDARNAAAAQNATQQQQIAAQAHAAEQQNQTAKQQLEMAAKTSAERLAVDKEHGINALAEQRYGVDAQVGLRRQMLDYDRQAAATQSADNMAARAGYEGDEAMAFTRLANQYVDADSGKGLHEMTPLQQRRAMEGVQQQFDVNRALNSNRLSGGSFNGPPRPMQERQMEVVGDAYSTGMMRSLGLPDITGDHGLLDNLSRKYSPFSNRSTTIVFDDQGREAYKGPLDNSGNWQRGEIGRKQMRTFRNRDGG